MNKFWIILWHTYWAKLRTKSFIITTIITSLIVVGLTNIENIINTFDQNDQKEKIAVLDETGELYPAFEQQLSMINTQLLLEEVKMEEQELEDKVINGDYTGYLKISLDQEQLPQGIYKAMTVTDTQVSSQLQQGLQSLKVAIATESLGITSEQLDTLFSPVKMEQVALEQNAKTEEELNQARGLVYILLFIIYMAVIMYASMIAMEVATEKSSRVMEILISSVSPVKQMFGKILGIGLLSITQFAVILLVGYTSLKQNLNSLEGGMFEFFGFGQLPVATFVYAIIFFLLGYFLFATLAAFLGSLVSRIEDVQQMITPMTLLIVGAFMIAMFGLSNPDSTFVTVTSFIPFFTPMIMFLRVGMLNIPFWEIGLGIGLLVLTITALAIFGASVYRGGVLMYGKSSSFKDIIKAIQLSKSK
ncbi:ABC transporter permease [Litchfieldia salsa]|uniref:ABC-2 type transport system permease protein n=1 Tax=Litchfieldia salsa TaxID=930152 RepID=A0A1H0UWC5_9BACI|nr:ABC transporter permease [Litchfieldia salsa]SDP70401.1 ABC-2 type transport system permease protein [Litchfieldia salsa]